MTRASQRGFLVHHGSWEYKCRLNGNVCNSKQKRNYDKFRHENKEPVD